MMLLMISVTGSCNMNFVAPSACAAACEELRMYIPHVSNFNRKCGR